MKEIKDFNIEIDFSENTRDINMDIWGNTLTIFLNPNIYLKRKIGINDIIHGADKAIKNIQKLFTDEISKEMFSNFELKFYKYLKNNPKEIFSKLNISIPYNEEGKRLMMLNNGFPDNNVIISKTFSVDPAEVKELLSWIGNYKNIKVNVEGNKDPVTIKEYLETIRIIENIAQHIKKYNFSPLEAIIYAYDIVRERVYKYEDEGDNPTKSRDLTSVVLGDRIVCLGFVNVFNAILKRLDVPCEEYLFSVKNKDRGHAKTIAYIKDDKYGIDGAYFFDPTWDSNGTRKYDNYKNSYRNFALTKEEVTDNNKNLIDITWTYQFDEIYDCIKKCVDSKDYKPIHIGIINYINNISTFFNNKKLITRELNRIDDTHFNYIESLFKYSVDESILDYLNKYKELINCKSIPREAFLLALYNVKKIEYYENPNEVDFSLLMLRHGTFLDRYSNNSTNFNDMLLQLLNGKKPEEYLRESEELKELFKKHDIEKNIALVKTTRVLRNIADSRK